MLTMRSAIRLRICSLLSHCACAPRKRATACTLALAGAFCTFVLLTSTQSRMPREEVMEQRLAEMHVHLQFLETLYNARQEELLAVQVKFLQTKNNNSQERSAASAHLYGVSQSSLAPELRALLRNATGTHAAQGFSTKHRHSLALASVYQLLPHLLNDPYSLKPAYHMKGGRSFVDIVLGIPTVKRDKESYLMIALTHLINGLDSEHENSTLIVVLVGETDLEYVFNIAHQIETRFPKQVKTGLIEVISPPSSFYPNFEELEPTLGDPLKRVKWRTKQNLDAMFLMTYAQTKGAFYLMLEDDIIAKKNYMKEIKKFASLVTISNPQWLILEFCHIGGIGKLFRSSSLQHFVTYVQLFYKNLPIDWLIESYLADRVCTIEKSSKQCLKNKLGIRPRYKTSLFQHIGLYSSLKGKIQKLKDSHYGTVPSFYPHSNPPLELIRSDIEEYADHTIQKAYDGATYFWGLKPKKGDTIEFHFKKPILLHRYLFRSGNVEHVSDKFTDTAVEVLPERSNGSYAAVGEFDEFGLAEGTLKKNYGRITAVRLNVWRDSKYWVILSEISLEPYEDQEDR